MTPFPASVETPRTRRWIIAACVVLLLAVAGYFVAPPAYHRLKRWRSQHLAAQAETALARNDWPTARDQARSAVLLSPNEPVALRVLARVFTRGTNLPAAATWQKLLQTGHATPDDRRSFVEQALRIGAGTAASGELDNLLKEEPRNPVNLWLAAQLFALAGDREQTIYYAARARLNDPTNQQYQLFLSSLRFDSEQEDQRIAAQSNVWSIATETNAFGLDALTFLARRRELTSDQRQRVAKLLRHHSESNTAHELLALGLDIQAAPERRDEFLNVAVTKYRAAEPEQRLQFAVWLNQNGEFTRALETLPLEDALKRKDFFIAHADALGSLKRWDELKKIFETQQTPLEEPYAEAFRARCEKQLGNETLADLHWKQAARAAERNPEQLTWLALYAEKCSEFDIAKTALRSLISCVENPKPAFQILERVTESSASTAELRELLGEMTRRWPDDLAYRNDYAYLSALLNTNVTEAVQTADALARQNPNSLPFRTTLALARFRQQDFVAAMRAFAGHDFRWDLALPNQRAVYAAVLAANGRENEARDLARGLGAGQLRPEELSLIAALR